MAAPVSVASSSLTPPGHHRFLYLLAAVAQAAGPLLTQPFVQRILSPEQWGRVSFAISLISVGLIVILAGLPLIITRTYFEAGIGPKHARSLAGFGILQSAGLGVLAVACAGAVALLSGQFTDQLSVLLALLSVGLLGCIQMCLAVLRAEHRASLFVGITIGAQTLGHLAGLGAVTFFSPTAASYLGAFSIIVLITALWSAVAVRPGAPFEFPRVIKSALKTSMPVLPHSIALVLMLQGESFLLTTMHGPALYGKYGAVLPMALGPLAVVLALSNVWDTQVLSQHGKDPHGIVKRTQREGAVVGVALALAGSSAAVFATNILVKSPTVEQFQLARLLPSIAMGYVIFLMSTTQMVAVGKTRLLAVITPLTAGVALLAMSWPASSESLFFVGLVKVSCFAALGAIYLLVARRYGKGLVHARPLLIGLAATAGITAIMLSLPTDFVTGLVTFGLAALLMAGAAAFLFLKRRQSARSAEEKQQSEVT
ncbi:hypothetical protein GCM10023346_45660 [Arthrobacter gyeryongensis]|uniref:Membrane protein involved in the export of O-antigen and teichoic acid n=1 Tax=Arthrobacter gyeryongensis TaxID=1650592 RepID=A0ABP9SUI1_9MICC